MNKFLITGMPRSGTTVLINTLGKLDDVFVYSDSKGFGEPFKVMNKTLELNPYIRLDSVEKECDSKYFGFKVFPNDLVNIEYLHNVKQYKTFVIIRKDIWKAIFSHALAKQTLFINNLDIFAGSSTLHPHDSKYDKLSDIPPVLLREFKGAFFHRVKQCYEFETRWKNINIIYFEDLIKPDASFGCLNEYFNKDIVFNLNYDNSHDSEAYYSNFSSSALHNLAAYFIKTIDIPNDCPGYIRDSIYKYYKE